MKNGNRIGKAYERAGCIPWQQAGVAAYRNGQTAGPGKREGGVADIFLGINKLWPELTKTEALNVFKKLEQAKADAGNEQIPFVQHKRNHQPAVVHLYLEDFIEMAVAAYGIDTKHKPKL